MPSKSKEPQMKAQELRDIILDAAKEGLKFAPDSRFPPASRIWNSGIYSRAIRYAEDTVNEKYAAAWNQLNIMPASFQKIQVDFFALGGAAEEGPAGKPEDAKGAAKGLRRLFKRKPKKPSFKCHVARDQTELPDPEKCPPIFMANLCNESDEDQKAVCPSKGVLHCLRELELACLLRSFIYGVDHSFFSGALVFRAVREDSQQILEWLEGEAAAEVFPILHYVACGKRFMIIEAVLEKKA